MDETGCKRPGNGIGPVVIAVEGPEMADNTATKSIDTATNEREKRANSPEKSESKQGTRDEETVGRMGLQLIDFVHLLVISSGYTLAMMLMSIYISFFPGVAQSRGASNTMVGAMVVSFSLVQVLGSPVTAMLVNRFGAKSIYLGGFLTTTLSTALFGILDLIIDDRTFIALCFCVRIAQAIGIVLIVTSSFTLATARFPQHVNIVSGVLEMTNGMASALGPSFGGILFDYGGFAAPFFTMAVMFAVCGVLVSAFVQQPESTCIRRHPTENLETTMERRDSLRLFASSYETWLVSGILVFVTFNWSAMSSYMQPFLKSSLDMSATEVGLLYLVGCGAFAISSPVWSLMANRSLNVFPQITACFVLLAISCVVIDPGWIDDAVHGQATNETVVISRTSVFVGFTLKETMMAGAFLPTLAALMAVAKRLGLPTNQLATHTLVNSWWYAARSTADIVGPLWAGPLADHFNFSAVLKALVGSNLTMGVAACWQAVLVAIRIKKQQQRQEQRWLLEENENKSARKIDGSTTAHNPHHR